MAFTRIGDLLNKRQRLLSQTNRVFDAMTVVAAWQKILADINNAEKFERTRALAFRNGNLTIQAASSTIAAELKMAEAKIISAYAKHFKNQVVERIIIKRH